MRVLAAVSRNGPRAKALDVHRSMARIGKPPKVHAIVRGLANKGLVEIDQALSLENGFTLRWYTVTSDGRQLLERELEAGRLIGRIA
jgi:hypothetical protein